MDGGFSTSVGRRRAVRLLVIGVGLLAGG